MRLDICPVFRRSQANFDPSTNRQYGRRRRKVVHSVKSNKFNQRTQIADASQPKTPYHRFSGKRTRITYKYILPRRMCLTIEVIMMPD